MYFRELIESGQRWEDYKGLLNDLSTFLVECVHFLVDGVTALQEADRSGQEHYHGTVLLLARHVAEFTDGVAVLCAEGCGEPSKPLLRSAFEAMLGVLYILEGDSENRGIAYQVAHAHRKIRLCRKMCEDAELRTLLSECDQPLDRDVNASQLLDLDCESVIRDLEEMLAQDAFAPLDEAYRRKRTQCRGRREPQWFSLRGGPNNIRELAVYLDKRTWYDYLYRHWSTSVHASDAFEKIGRGQSGGPVIKPLRHPADVQLAISLGSTLCLATCSSIVDHCAPTRAEEFRLRWKQSLRKRHLELSGGRQLIIAPWLQGHRE